MKKLSDIDSGKILLRVEAARIAFEILSLSYSDLRSNLIETENNGVSFSGTVNSLRNSWGFIDSAYRYLTVVSQIRGLKHKDERYKEGERSLLEIEKHRNFIQHLNSSIPKLQGEIYPIAGSLSWPSQDKNYSHTLSLGKLPKDTYFHSLSYDLEKMTFCGDIMFHLENHELNLTKQMNVLSGCNSYLNEWLVENDYLTEEDLAPNFLNVGELSHLANGGDYVERYVRVRFKVD